MTEIQTLQSQVDLLKGAKTQLERQRRGAKALVIKLTKDVAATEEAQVVIQKIAAQTQEQIRYHITALGTMALQAVFGTEDIELGLEFQEKGGKTDAHINFLRGPDKLPTNPLDQDSGGASDIAAFALRCSLWAMKKPKNRAVIVLDEPCKNINDSSREMHRRFADVIREVSDRLGVQFLIVTAMPELEDIADNLIKL